MSLLKFAACAVFAAILFLGMLTGNDARAQVPIPLQEQIDAFSTLPAAQQQALIRELQRQLPPAQRAAVLGMLQQGSASTPADSQTAPAPVTALPTALEAPPRAARLRAGDTLVVDLEPGLEPTEQAAQSEEELADTAALRERILDGNPYELDSLGRLYLPGVPAMDLAGLDVSEATIRLGAERDLRNFDITLSHLPLDPVGTDALEPFGYSIFRSVPSTFAPATDIPVPVDYVIGPGDTINIQLFGNQNAEYFLQVSREGSINFPEIGPLTVAGLTFFDVRNLVDERVREQMIGTRASTTLGELRSIRVFVLGEVEQPGSYTVSSLATMTNALLASGGVTSIGSLRNIALNREGTTQSTLDLYDLLLRGDTRGDARLQPGDVIFVPPVGPTVAVDGEVRRPAIYELRSEQTVAELVTLSGGLNPNADQSSVKLERIVPGRGVSVTDLNLAGATGQFAVRDGDVLRIEPNLDQIEESVRLAGNVQRPGLYQWRSGMTLSDLLPSPELVKPLSDLNYVLIRREIAANVDIDVLSVDVEAIWRRAPGAVDLELRPRDTVYVFHLETGRRQYVDPIIEELVAQAGPNEPLPVVRIGGQVRAPGQYPLEPGMRVADLLRAGGGLNDAAYTVEAELIRYAVIGGEYRETELLNVALDAIVTGNAGADITLEPYDYLNVKEISSWREQEAVTLAGEVVFPGTYLIRQGETLSSVLERAGGLTEFAFPEGSVFTREEARQRELAQLERLAQRLEADLASMSLADPGSADARSTGEGLLTQLRSTQATGRLVIRLADIVAGRPEADIIMQGGDRLLVPELRQEVTVLGEVQYPTSHTHEVGLDRDDYINKSGGLTRRADKRRVYVVRASGEVVVDGGVRWFRRDAGGEIRPGDTVVAPIDIDRVRPITLWSSVTQIIYNLAVAAAAVSSF